MANSRLTAQIKNRFPVKNTAETESSFADIPSSFAKDTKKQVSAVPDDFFSQLLGMGDFEKSDHAESKGAEEAKPYEKFTLYDSDRKSSSHVDAKAESPKAERKPAIAAAMDYHAEMARGSERSSKKEKRELQMHIQEITQELQRIIASSSKMLQVEYGSYQVSAAPKDVGKYHTNFLAWMLNVVRTARQQVEDAGAWMAVAKGKGSKRGYVQSSKSMGTSFTQSNERSVATQTG
ncbi:hypothetical protein BH09PAT1_BH09PAT1_1000 [soil metagenome]